jgi:3-oxoacyl-[acyl-carrier-protein] synthase III
VSDFGNTGGSGAPTVLSGHWDALGPGDRVAICLAGAGLTWANLLLSVEDLP